MTRTSLRGTGESPFTVHDPAFLDVLGEHPQLDHVLSVDAHEGPVYVADEDALYFTTLPGPGQAPARTPQVAVKRLALDGDSFPVDPGALSTLRAEANAANGMTLGQDGELIVCEQGSRVEHARVSRVDRSSGHTETVVDGWRGLRLNSPNDVVVARDGAVWFTDPSYGYLQGFRPEPVVGDYLYRYDPATRSSTVVADSFVKPNGLAFSPDEHVLYVTDSGANQEPGSYHVGLPHHVVAFDVLGGRHLSAPRLFAVTTPGFPDGIKVDVRGRVYVSCFDGVQVFDPAGDLIGEIGVPGGAVNFCFGGPGRNVLFITTDTDIWAAVLATSGT